MIYISDISHAGYLNGRLFQDISSLHLFWFCGHWALLAWANLDFWGEFHSRKHSLPNDQPWEAHVGSSRYSHSRAIPSMTRGSEWKTRRRWKRKGTWFPISLEASLALPLRLKCFLSGEQRTLIAPGCFVRYLRPLWRVGRVGQLRRVEPLSEFSNGWNIVKWRESYQD